MIQAILLLYLIDATVGIPAWIWVMIIGYIIIGFALAIFSNSLQNK